MASPFQIDEDDLTNAIFHNTPLNAEGSGSKLDARIQARRMLADSSALDAAFLLAAALEPLKEKIGTLPEPGRIVPDSFPVDITLSVRECRNILHTMAKLEGQ